ncbi:hypothetical protein AK812_SmicGene33394 [Symbiodinium microadriaticum]|uniref:Uncharacterized protein n=1 Tax=Symbiodinium microadriaticum TaxID=2951 RepID=A0A1Q9CRN8_SYMMI|nr:hypothetical protein AK812_SmicGene33394 [Symbiodinium microadriaticum]
MYAFRCIIIIIIIIIVIILIVFPLIVLIVVLLLLLLIIVLTAAARASKSPKPGWPIMESARQPCTLFAAQPSVSSKPIWYRTSAPVVTSPATSAPVSPMVTGSPMLRNLREIRPGPPKPIELNYDEWYWKVYELERRRPRGLAAAMLEHVAYPLTHQLSNLSAELRVHSLRERVRTAAPLRAAAACGDLVHVQQGLRQVDTSSEAAKVALQVAVSAGQSASG